MNMKIPPKYEADYIAAYDTSNGPKTFAGQFLFQGHRLLEKTCPKKEFRTILEVGAGTGHHMEHVKGGFEKYFFRDVVLRVLKLTYNSAKHKVISPERLPKDGTLKWNGAEKPAKTWNSIILLLHCTTDFVLGDSWGNSRSIER